MCAAHGRNPSVIAFRRNLARQRRKYDKILASGVAWSGAGGAWPAGLMCSVISSSSRPVQEAGVIFARTISGSRAGWRGWAAIN